MEYKYQHRQQLGTAPSNFIVEQLDVVGLTEEHSSIRVLPGEIPKISDAFLVAHSKCSSYNYYMS